MTIIFKLDTDRTQILTEGKYGDVVSGEMSKNASEKIESEECTADDLIPLFHALHQRLRDSHLLSNVFPCERLWYLS